MSATPAGLAQSMLSDEHGLYHFSAVRPGDRVGLWAPNRYEWIVVHDSDLEDQVTTVHAVAQGLQRRHQSVP